MSATTTHARPESLAEARDAVRDSPGALRFVGAGTKADWGATPERVDSVISTTGLSGILSHNPGDATVAVRAGTPLRDLQEALAEHGQWLAIDPPHVEGGATVAGVLAANDSGPRRLRYGSMRDLIIGATVVLADGSVARSGGNVIKNVAGYDLAKLWCGSLGTLGLLGEIVLRLHPVAEASATVAIGCNAPAATRLTLALLASPLEPSALDWANETLWLRFDGRPDAVAAQADSAVDLARAHGTEARTLDRDEATSRWERLVADLGGSGGETVVRGATMPGDLAAAAKGLAEVNAGTGVTATLSSHTGLGLHTARLAGGHADAHARVVDGWRSWLAGFGGHAVVRRRVDGFESHGDVWGPPPSAVGLMRRVKAELDPQRRCAPGVFTGGI